MNKRVEVNAGDRYGKLTIIKEVEPRYFPSGHIVRQFLCKCDCGNEVVAGLQMIRQGHRKSCGCIASEGNRTHKDVIRKDDSTKCLSETRIYHIWGAMKRRCNNPKSQSYKDYGGRGIKVCNEWQKFKPFYEWAMENGYTDELTIDRIDVNGNYEPSNCRWATPLEQGSNKRNNRNITYNGITKTLAQWSRETGLSQVVILDRLKRVGLTDDIFAPLYNTKQQRSHKTYTKETEIRELFAEGKSSLEISKITNIKHEHIKKALQRWKLI